MFCPNCGKSEQAPDSYCRSCGQFLTDFSSKSYLINKILGGNKPETQVNINLTINIVTTLASCLLLGFLNGYYDSLYEKTGQKAPTIIYLVYIFLGLIAAWQTLGFIVNSRLKKKLSARKKAELSVDSEAGEKPVTSGPSQKSLPEADFANVVPPSVVEDTTKMLDKSPRRRS
jgi:hypothetical protein